VRVMSNTSYSTVFYGPLMVFSAIQQGADSECSVFTLVHVSLPNGVCFGMSGTRLILSIVVLYLLVCWKV
jgi:hypothetical protein